MFLKTFESLASLPNLSQYRTAENRKRCFYIAVSGNTASGKSSIISMLSRTRDFHSDNTIFVDETLLHHPLLKSLFYSVADYGFQLQLNFMLQRHLMCKHLLDFGYNIVMERCHFDDLIFAVHLLQIGALSRAEFKLYKQLWLAFDRRLRHPDVVVYFSTPPKVSLDRLTRAEQNEERPREFRSEFHKKQWVYGWAKLYEQMFARTVKGFKSVCLIELSHLAESETILPQIRNALVSCGKFPRQRLAR